MLYSPTTGGFYTPEIHGDNIPVDAIKLTDPEYRALLDGQAQGKPIKANANGRPYNEEPPPRTLDQAKADKLAALAAKRFVVETGGVTVAGTVVKTDRESQATLTGAWVRAQRNPAVSIQWKGAAGWVTVGAAEIEAMADAVGDHVQACFDHEKALADEIAALTTISAVDSFDIESGW